jgi:hypothetical protein
MSQDTPGSCAVAADGAVAMTSVETPVRPRPAAAHPAAPQAVPASPAAPARRDGSRLGAFRARVGAFLFFLAVSAALYAGWAGRDAQALTPESGLGYALGIVGATMMLLLALYPLRKRARFMRNTGPVRHWFRAHMIKGVLGPTLILFHANFQTGSLNSNVALFAMLVVATSGLVGRFIYTKVHYGLYGSRASLAALKADAREREGNLAARFAFAPQLHAQLQAVEAAALAPRGPLARLRQLATLGFSLRASRLRLGRFMAKALAARARHEGWTRRERRRQKREARRYLRQYLRTVRRVAEFSFYERIFGAWHVLHFPLFLMLIVAGVVHVFAVHMY